MITIGYNNEPLTDECMKSSHSHYAEHVWMNHVFKKPKKEEYIVNAKYWMPLPDEPSKQ
jgi:hypothetical protein